jgi:hypothetical protein
MEYTSVLPSTDAVFSTATYLSIWKLGSGTKFFPFDSGPIRHLFATMLAISARVWGAGAKNLSQEHNSF